MLLLQLLEESRRFGSERRFWLLLRLLLVLLLRIGLMTRQLTRIDCRRDLRAVDHRSPCVDVHVTPSIRALLCHGLLLLRLLLK